MTAWATGDIPTTAAIAIEQKKTNRLARRETLLRVRLGFELIRDAAARAASPIGEINVANLSMQCCLSKSAPSQSTRAQKPRSVLRPDRRPNMSRQGEGKWHTKKNGASEKPEKPVKVAKNLRVKRHEKSVSQGPNFTVLVSRREAIAAQLLMAVNDFVGFHNRCEICAKW